MKYIELDKIVDILDHFDGLDSDSDSSIDRKMGEKVDLDLKDCKLDDEGQYNCGNIRLMDFNRCDWKKACDRLRLIDGDPNLELVALVQIEDDPIRWRMAYKELNNEREDTK